MFLSENPILEALEMDQTNSTSTFACNNQWVIFVFLRTPADSALNVVLVLLIKILDTFDFLSFLQLLIVKLTFRHCNLITFEIFHSKTDSSKLDSIKFLNLVIILSGLILQGTGNKPKPIY